MALRIAVSSLRLLTIYLLSLASIEVESRKAHTINFKHPQLYPKNFDWDEQRAHFILGSITAGILVTVSDAGVSENLIQDADYTGKASTLGVRVDLKRNRVLTVVRSFLDSGTGFDALAAYNLHSKQRIFLAKLDTTEMNDGEKVLANDIAVDFSGNAYVTNSAGNFVWKVTAEGKASTFVKSIIFSSQTVIVKDGTAAECSLNGIAYDKRHFLLISQAKSGKLFRVALDDSSVRVVHINQPLVGIDSIVLRTDNALVAASTHTIWLLRSMDVWMSAHVVDRLVLDSSSNATSVAFRDNDQAYILHSYVEEAFQGTSRDIFTIQAITFPSDRDEPIWLIVTIVLFVTLVSAWRFQLIHVLKEYRKKRD